MLGEIATDALESLSDLVRQVKSINAALSCIGALLYSGFSPGTKASSRPALCTA
jgi:hypothetical protein